MEKAFALPSADGILNTAENVCVCVCVCVSVCEKERVGESNGNEAKKCHQGQEASNPKLTDILIGTSEF